MTANPLQVSLRDRALAAARFSRESWEGLGRGRRFQPGARPGGRRRDRAGGRDRARSRPALPRGSAASAASGRAGTTWGAPAVARCAGPRPRAEAPARSPAAPAPAARRPPKGSPAPAGFPSERRAGGLSPRAHRPARPRRWARRAAMGETMSKRLRLHLGAEAEMEERAFPNPFPDYEAAASADAAASAAAEDTDDACPAPGPDELGLPFHGDGKIIHSFTRRIQTKIKDLLQQMEEGLKTADPHDCSAYTGWTGIALLYLQLYRVTCDQTHLLRSLDYVKRTLRNLNGRRVTFLCGDAGPLAVGAVVYHKLRSDGESQECIAKLLQLQRSIVCQDSDLPDELLYGRAGYLYALLYLNTEIGPGTVCESAVREVVTAIIESGKALSREERKAERCPLLYQWHRKQYVGAAHGMAGIYYMLMQPSAKVDQETLAEMVKPSIDYVRHKRFRSGNYPSSLSNETDRLVHWCHGAPGVIHMLMQAYKVFKEDKYLKDALECSDVIWQRGLLRKGYGLCHGTAGNGYSFLSLYHLTQDRKYLYRACKFAEWCLDYGAHGCRIPDRPYSLFEGMAGAIHFLSDVLAPETSRFPAFELSSSQPDKKM